MLGVSWYPSARRVPASRSGGSHAAAVRKVVLHTTESDSYRPSTSSYFGHQNWPHLTLDRPGLFVQHIGFDRSAYALANASGGVETNRAGVIQIEIVGRAAGGITAEQVMALREFGPWLEANSDVPFRQAAEFLRYPDSYGGSRVRLAPQAWLSAVGWLGHQHVPENSHGDPGAIPVAAIFNKENEVTPEQMAAINEWLKQTEERLSQRMVDSENRQNKVLKDAIAAIEGGTTGTFKVAGGELVVTK